MILNSGAVTPKRYTQLANDILQRDVEDNLEAMRDMVGMNRIAAGEGKWTDNWTSLYDSSWKEISYASIPLPEVPVGVMNILVTAGRSYRRGYFDNYKTGFASALHYFRKEETKWGKQLAKVNEFRKQHPQLNNTQRDEVLLELQKAYEVTAYYDSKVKRILGITKDDKQSTREYRMKTLLIDQVVKQVDGSEDESLWKWCHRRLKKFQAELADQARG